jgi:hypothetical protein
MVGSSVQAAGNTPECALRIAIPLLRSGSGSRRMGDSHDERAAGVSSRLHPVLPGYRSTTGWFHVRGQGANESFGTLDRRHLSSRFRPDRKSLYLLKYNTVPIKPFVNDRWE